MDHSTDNNSTKRMYQSKFSRKFRTDSIELTERDGEILQAINRCRYLKVSHLHRLLNGENASKQALQRRLRKLYDAGFVDRYQSYVRQGESPGEIAYYLGNEGAQFLQSLGEVVHFYPKAGKIRHQFFDHAMALVDCRVDMELAVRNRRDVHLLEFICDFEVRSHMHTVTSKDRYRLFESFQDAKTRRKYYIYPDGLILLGSRNHPSLKMLYFVEIDQSTEKLSFIHEKLQAYTSYIRSQMTPVKRDNQHLGYQSRYGFLFGIKILFICKTNRRVHSLTHLLLDRSGFLAEENLILFTDRASLNAETVLSAPIWLQADQRRVSLLKDR